MKVVILCGGLGTRLREETEFRPKPLVEIGQRPVLWHIMKLYAHYGYRDFVLCLGYRGNMIKDYFLNYEAFTNDFTICLGQTQKAITYHDVHQEQDFSVTLADTGPDTMTGGRVRRIARYIEDDTFLLSYGDGVADLDVGRLVAFHRGHGKVATLTTVRPQSRYGVLDVDPAGRVRKFAEKPRLDQWANIGYFVLNRRIFDYLGGDDCVLEQAPLERLAAQGQLMAYRHEGFFFAMDTYRDYKAINDMWSAGQRPWVVWE
ncbi:MAG: glucose-1-phosphate cytidylyltransferase [Planctomycetota bacterium]